MTQSRLFTIRLRASAAILVLFTMTVAVRHAQAQQAAAGCDHDCLVGVLSNYEHHMQAHDASGIAVTPDFRSVENYKPMQLGTGYFTRAGRIFHQEQFADAVNGQVAAIGLLDDGGRDAYFVLRLKVEPGQRLSQAEMLLIHDGETSFLQKDRNTALDPTYQAMVPQEQRTRREDMVRAVDNFTDAWQYKEGALAPFDAGCTFSENNVMLSEPGVTTCGDMLEYAGRRGIPGAGTSPDHGNPSDPIRPMTPADPSIGRPPLQGPWIRDRRVPIVDTDRGVVVAWHIQGGEPARPGETIEYARSAPFGMKSEDHRRTATENRQATGHGGGPPPPPPGMKMMPMGAAYMAGLFKIVNGKIVRVDHFEWEGGANASGGFADGPRF